MTCCSASSTPRASSSPAPMPIGSTWPHASPVPSRCTRSITAWTPSYFCAGANAAPRTRAPLILAVGRFVEKKGLRYLVEACRGCTRPAGVPCLLVGEDGGEAPLLAPADRRKPGIADHVTLRAPMDHDALRAIYAEAAVFALPCLVAADGDRDGIPNVMAEAMAMGVPVVTTRCLRHSRDRARRAQRLSCQPARTRRLWPPHCSVLKDRTGVARTWRGCARARICDCFDSSVHDTFAAAALRARRCAQARRRAVVLRPGDGGRMRAAAPESCRQRLPGHGLREPFDTLSPAGTVAHFARRRNVHYLPGARSGGDDARERIDAMLRGCFEFNGETPCAARPGRLADQSQRGCRVAHPPAQVLLRGWPRHGLDRDSGDAPLCRNAGSSSSTAGSRRCRPGFIAADVTGPARTELDLCAAIISSHADRHGAGRSGSSACACLRSLQAAGGAYLREPDSGAQSPHARAVRDLPRRRGVPGVRRAPRTGATSRSARARAQRRRPTCCRRRALRTVHRLSPPGRARTTCACAGWRALNGICACPRRWMRACSARSSSRCMCTSPMASCRA